MNLINKMSEFEYHDESVHDLNVAMYNPDEMEQQSKRRKSRFDSALLPTTASLNISQPTAPAQQYESSQIAFDSKTGQFLEYSSIVDSVFKRRLDDSLQKNFLYLSILDDRQRQQELGIFAAVPSANTSTAKSQSKFRQFFQNKSVKAPKIGIGSEAVIDQPKLQPNTKVYVNYLPLDITEEEIDILFSPQGKIKKIKLYKDNQGKKKGDALVTFVSADSALLACRKLDKLNIGDGHTISVSLAEFTASSSTVLELNTRCIPEDFRDSFHNNLPEVLKSMHSSKVMLSNCYDSTVTEEALSTLEIEMMITACSYGDIDSIERIMAPNSSSSADDSDTIRSVFGDCGCFIIAFRDDHTAEACAVGLHGSMFNGKKIAAHWMPKSPMVLQNEELQTIDDDMKITVTTELASNDPRAVVVAEDRLHQELVDVEDFLNSLL